MDSILEAVRQLPVQDTLWIITMVTDTESDGENQLVVILDAQCRMLASSHADAKLVNFSTQAYQLLCDCALHPMIGQPRKPRYIKVKTEICSDTLEVEDLGICRIWGQIPCSCCTVAPSMKTCCCCQFRGSPELFIKCPDCRTVYYCSTQCLNDDSSPERGRHSHAAWCSKMAAYTADADKLADLPFSFTTECTSATFDKTKLQQFLQFYGVFGLGFWRRECWNGCQKGAANFGDLPDEVDPYVLPLEGMILEDDPPRDPSNMAPDLADWSAYYRWRGFNLDSPICVLLQFPLTLYHILHTRIHIDYPSLNLLCPCRTVVIHIVGVEKEADMAPVFQEIGILFPQVHFEMHFFGPHISKKVHKKHTNHKNVEITMHRKLYHKTKQKPDLVLGYNAGIGAYMSWTDTLIKLKAEQTPTYFTDYCQYSCTCAKAPMENLHLGTASSPSINPFRSPLRINCEEHDMPWYSNAFIFHLQYDQ